MKHTRGRVVLVESVDDLDRRLSAGARDLAGWRLCGLDLADRSAELAACRVAGATFVGCELAAGDRRRIEVVGGLVLPAPAERPVDVHRTALYTPDELYDNPTYARSLDALAYAWSQRPASPQDMLAMALHDHAVDGALAAWAGPRRLVGVMGGHAAHRDDAAYADAARLGHALGAAYSVATGGGPGAMEAVNLGARLSRRPGSDLDQALGMLADVPTFRPSLDAWAEAAFDVCGRFADPVDSVGIPTWHYGHEPPNVFATVIAKYFRNATREAILLEICGAGIVFLPGAGGTVQEIFQDACENYYADETSVAPMVLVGRTYWTETLPAWPLLQALARGRPMERHVHLVETLDEAVAVLSPPAAR
ncbi:MAG: Rossmann fold nucleotide-binding protein [Nocardioides sp.]